MLQLVKVIVQKDALKFGHTFAIENSIEKP